jgi:hypothetical protein
MNHDEQINILLRILLIDINHLLAMLHFERLVTDYFLFKRLQNKFIYLFNQKLLSFNVDRI